jgi:hypothetical protein
LLAKRSRRGSTPSDSARFSTRRTATGPIVRIHRAEAGTARRIAIHASKRSGRILYGALIAA